MRKLYCEKCKEDTPHRYYGREHEFDEDGFIIRGFMAVVSVGLTEAIGNKTIFYKCKCCGHIKCVDV